MSTSCSGELKIKKIKTICLDAILYAPLTLTILGEVLGIGGCAKTADDKVMTLFFQEIGFSISYKLSSKETSCMNCQSQLLTNIRKMHCFKMSSAETFTQHVSANGYYALDKEKHLLSPNMYFLS